MKLSDGQRSYLLRDHMIGGAVINATISALLAWLTFRKHGFAPMQGDPNALNDLIGTALLLPLIICLIATPLIRKQVQAGKVEPWLAPSPQRTMLLWLPANPVLRGLTLALAALATIAPVLLAVLLALGVHSFSLGGFVVLKMSYSGVIGALVSPLCALYVMASAHGSVALINE